METLQDTARGPVWHVPRNPLLVIGKPRNALQKQAQARRFVGKIGAFFRRFRTSRARSIQREKPLSFVSRRPSLLSGAPGANPDAVPDIDRSDCCKYFGG